MPKKLSNRISHTLRGYRPRGLTL